MYLFEVFSETTPQTLYVHRPLINVDDFLKWAKDQGFEHCLETDNLHVTLVYSKEKVLWQDTAPVKSRITIDGGSRKVSQFGDDATVLEFESDELQERWKELLEIGCGCSYRTYCPHVTITYRKHDLKNVEPYDGKLIFGPEIFRPTLKPHHKSFSEITLVD